MKTRRKHYIIADHAMITGNDVAISKTPHMSHMQIPRYTGISKMKEEFFSRLPFRLINPMVKPLPLPFLLDGYIVILFQRHNSYPLGK